MDLSDLSLRDRLVVLGERFGLDVRFSRDEIAEFARLTYDTNPLHSDRRIAERARFGEIIASGQQTSAAMMGVVASHFSRSDDGVPRQMLCLNFNFAFKQPVFADQELRLQWKVGSVEWSDRLQGVIGQLDGTASVRNSRPSVVGRGTVLVQLAVP